MPLLPVTPAGHRSREAAACNEAFDPSQGTHLLVSARASPEQSCVIAWRSRGHHGVRRNAAHAQGHLLRANNLVDVH